MANNNNNTKSKKEIENEFFKKYGPDVHLDPVRFINIAKLCKGRVLDLGCGTGHLADFWEGSYIGIDISDVATTYAKTLRRETATFITEDITQPWKDDGVKWDTIVMAEFLEHLTDDKIIFENIKKVASKNARIIISVPNGDRIPDPDHFRTFIVPELRKRFSSLGRVKFHNWSGFAGRILMTIDLGQENENLLALVMIAKNEGKGLERAILSCIDYVDKIVLSVDCWSEDNTLDIAKRYADVVKRHAWEDDFSKARNFAQKGVDSKWILSLDGHEYLEACPDLREKLKDPTEAYLIKIRMENDNTFYASRLYRSFLQWHEPIHNTLKTKEVKAYKKFVLRHDRLEGQSKKAALIRAKQREKMMPKLLKKELKRKGGNARAHFYLARWYYTQAKLKKALKYFKKFIRKSENNGQKWSCCYEASICANGMKRPLLALRFLDKAEEIIPNRWEISKHRGLTYMLFDRWKKAIFYLTDSFKINTGDFSFSPERQDKADIWDKIGFCYFQLKKYKKAKVCWEEAIANEENSDKRKLNKKRIELIDRDLVK